MITLELPFPPFKLSPNARVHWGVRKNLTAQYRQAGFLIAKSKHNIATSLPEKIPVTLIFHKPSRRKMDLDGCLSRTKSILDGISECWGIDDERFRPITIDFAAEPVKNGKVVATFG